MGRFQNFLSRWFIFGVELGVLSYLIGFVLVTVLAFLGITLSQLMGYSLVPNVLSGIALPAIAILIITFFLTLLWNGIAWIIYGIIYEILKFIGGRLYGSLNIVPKLFVASFLISALGFILNMQLVLLLVVGIFSYIVLWILVTLLKMFKQKLPIQG